MSGMATYLSHCPVCTVPGMNLLEKVPRKFDSGSCPAGNQEGSWGIYYQGECCEHIFMVVVGRHKGDGRISVVEVKETYGEPKTLEAMRTELSAGGR